MLYTFLLLLICPFLLKSMDELPLKKRFSTSQKNIDYQDPVKITQGELIESYRQGGDALFQEKSDKLSMILQKNGVTANAIARISLRIKTDSFEIFSPRNRELETILESEDIHSDTISEVIEEVKDENE